MLTFAKVRDMRSNSASKNSYLNVSISKSVYRPKLVKAMVSGYSFQREILVNYNLGLIS